MASIAKFGILSRSEVLARKLTIDPIEEPGVLERRKVKKIPGTNKWLNDYANLYFDAHNPMLSARRHLNDVICVLRIKRDVLSLDGVVVTDQNASRDCWFKPVDQGLPLLNGTEIYAGFWINKNDPVEEYRLKGIKCAEVLVPKCVHPSYIFSAYVANKTALANFKQVAQLPVEINGSLFF